MRVKFFVPGIPATAGSKNAFRTKTGKIVMAPANKRQKPWMSHVANCALDHCTKQIIFGAAALCVTFILPRPISHYGTGKNRSKLKLSAPRYPITKPDLTKLLRAAEDALKGILWRDDSQVVQQSVRKEYVSEKYPNPGAIIVVEEKSQL
jgi:Holliday junction resolvase RusA-like endonuclease